MRYHYFKQSETGLEMCTADLGPWDISLLPVDADVQAPDILLGEEAMWFSRIVTGEAARGQGLARQVMAEVLADADRHRVHIILTINPYGPMDFDALWEWYHRMGFEDLSTNPEYHGLMHRAPRRRIEGLKSS